MMNHQIRLFCRVTFFGFKHMPQQRGFSFSSRYHSVKISYKIYPEGSQPEQAQKSPIFILHGVFGSKTNWHSLAKNISSATHRQVVTLDARNHGESEHAPSMNYLAMRDDLLGVMDLLKVERPILLGHSMGGKTVMSCALSVPERVESLIVVDTAPKDSPGGNTLRLYAEKMKSLGLPAHFASLAECRRRLGDLLKPVVKDEGIRMFLLTNLKQASDNTCSWRVNLDAVINSFDALHAFPKFQDPCTNIDTVFIGGGNSEHIDSSAKSAILKWFPKATIQLIPGAGHWVHSEKPAEFVDLVKEFVLKSTV